MSSENNEKQKAIARAIVRDASTEEQEALSRWAEGLLQIRSKNVPALKKVTDAVQLTRDSGVITPVIKKVGKELKRVGWDERSWKARLGWGGVIVTVMTVGNTGAGLAALGSAIGVPLWIVIGAGGTFAGTIIDEVKTKSNKSNANYAVINAEKEIERK